MIMIIAAKVVTLFQTTKHFCKKVRLKSYKGTKNNEKRMIYVNKC